MSPDMKAWLEIIDKAGFLAVLLACIVIFGITAMPKLVRWWAAATEQSETLSDAIPRMEASLSRMADGNQLLISLLRELRASIDSNHERLDRKVDRLLKRAGASSDDSDAPL